MYKKILLIPYAIKGLAGFYFTLDFIEPFFLKQNNCIPYKTMLKYNLQKKRGTIMFDENKLRFQIIPGDKEIVTSLERLKYASFDALNDEITVSLGEFLERNMTGLMALYENEIVAGCFACNHAPILYISSLFVKKEYQRCGYHLGKRILLKTLQQKAEFEKHYKEHFEIAKMYAMNEKLKNLYLSWGFEAPYGSLLVRKYL